MCSCLKFHFISNLQKHQCAQENMTNMFPEAFVEMENLDTISVMTKIWNICYEILCSSFKNKVDLCTNTVVSTRHNVE